MFLPSLVTTEMVSARVCDEMTGARPPARTADDALEEARHFPHTLTTWTRMTGSTSRPTASSATARISASRIVPAVVPASSPPTAHVGRTTVPRCPCSLFGEAGAEEAGDEDDRMKFCIRWSGTHALCPLHQRQRPHALSSARSNNLMTPQKKTGSMDLVWKCKSCDYTEPCHTHCVYENKLIKRSECACRGLPPRARRPQLTTLPPALSQRRHALREPGDDPGSDPAAHVKCALQERGVPGAEGGVEGGRRGGVFPGLRRGRQEDGAHVHLLPLLHEVDRLACVRVGARAPW